MVDKFMAGTFFLILVFLLLSRANEFNSIVNSTGSFVLSQTQALQGISTKGATVIKPTGTASNGLSFLGSAV